MSYDVVSLFTKTPIKEECEIITKRLENDKTLKKITNLNIDDIMELLKFVLETTYFRFEGEIYQQKFGVAMGSPVSPIVVNLHTEDLEQKIIATAPVDCQPGNWKRYVDNVICLLHTGKAKTLQQHMDTVDPIGSIIFTREDEENNSMPFCEVHQKGRWQCEVYSVQEEDAHRPILEICVPPPQTSEVRSGQNPYEQV